MTRTLTPIGDRVNGVGRFRLETPATVAVMGVSMRGLWRNIATLTVMVTAVMVAGPVAVAASAAPQSGRAAEKCSSVRPEIGFYEAGRVGSEWLTVPSSACTTISVSHIKDAANPSDRCQTFLVGIFSPDGSELNYTEPVTACSIPAKTRTVLATGVADGSVYFVIYVVDYIEPGVQRVRYKVWH